MTTCSRCGHRIEVGRFCINCGAPAEPPGPSATAVIGPTDTVERPVVASAGPPPSAPPPPPLPPAPSAARYPLFADEVREGPSATDRRATPPSPPADGPAHRGGSSWLIWVVSAAVLVVVALVGATLLLAGGDDEADRAGTDDTSTSGTPATDSASDGAPSSVPVDPSPPTEEPPSGEPRDVSADAIAAVPSTAPPGTAADGTRTRYDATQMLDDDPGTCWRMAGDGTGEEITLTLAEPTLVTGLGLVNGYAKTAQDARGRRLDWYRGNRRVLAVEWVLDDGTVVPQDLRETRDLQGVEIDPVVTGSVVLRLVEVSGPGRGRAARDNTAISEVTVLGTPEAG